MFENGNGHASRAGPPGETTRRNDDCRERSFDDRWSQKRFLEIK
jgi:hypothetical protein